MGALRLLIELMALLLSSDGRIPRLQVLRHPLTDYVHQSLKCLLHVNVVLGTGLKKLKACVTVKGKRHYYIQIKLRAARKHPAYEGNSSGKHSVEENPPS